MFSPYLLIFTYFGFFTPTYLVPQVYICVIPVRMLEAWLLFNEAAIRKAAGNPRGKEQLQIPDIRRLQQLPDPKNDLHQLLSIASGLTGRRQKQFNVHEKIHRLADLIDDFSSSILLDEIT